MQGNNLGLDRKVLELFWNSFWILFWNTLETINFDSCRLNFNFVFSFCKGVENCFN
jgi:hypothetical protein